MNMRSFAVVLGSVASLALMACGTSTTGGSGGGSAGGGTGGESSTGGSSAGGSSAGGSSAGGAGQGGAGGAAACQTCAAAIDPMTGDPAQLCDMSKPIFDALSNCACTTTCKADCGDNKCAMKDISAACTTCLDQADKGNPPGCKDELDACTGDL